MIFSPNTDPQYRCWVTTQEATVETEDINISRDKLLALIVPAAVAGPPGLAEKMLAYHRQARYDFIILPEHALSTDERTFILSQLVEQSNQTDAPGARDGALAVGRDR